MATNDEKKRLKKNQKVLNSADIKNLKDRIENSDKNTTASLYNVDQDFINRNQEDFNKIKATIKNVDNKYKEVTGQGTIEFLSKILIDNEISSERLTQKNKYANGGRLNLNNIIDTANNGIINEIFIKEKDRFELYDDYKAIYALIPQLSQAIDVFTDNIMSPDDFTKDVFNVFYNNKNISSINDEKRIINNLKSLEDIYKLENKCKEWINKTLYIGDQFIAVLPLEKELNEMISEDGKLIDNTHSEIFNENNILISNEEIERLNEFYNEGKKEANTNIEWKKDLIKLMNDNVSFSENSLTVIKDELLLESDFSSVNIRDNFKNFSSSDITISDKNKKKTELITTGLLDNDKEKNEILQINGSFIKELDPRRIIKIKVGETCFGYYYIELDNRADLFKQNTGYNTLEMRSSIDLRTDTEYVADPKTRLIVDLFAKNISKKINKKFIADNKEFKNLIYELIKQNYIIDKRIQIIYLNPGEVEHLMVEEDSDTGYGISVFKKILFSAKLYLAVLTCTLMMKISRSQDHRTFYIETGLSKDVEGIIQSFVREIKSKEVKLSDLKSIDTIFNSIGQFSDYFIPQVNGEKAIDIDTIPGMNTEVENDFLEYLKKTMISGMGIPASFLQYSDEMEFARSVSMMNGMFLRKIVGKQKKLGACFTNIYRLLYKNEYDTDGKKHLEDSININYNDIEVKFPPPASLNMTNLGDQISTTQTISDFIVTTLVGQSADDKIRDAVQKEVVKKLLPNIEWDIYENLLEDIKKNTVKNKLIEKIEGPSEEEV